MTRTDVTTDAPAAISDLDNKDFHRADVVDTEWIVFVASGETDRKNGALTDRGFKQIESRIEIASMLPMWNALNDTEAFYQKLLTEVELVLVAPNPGAIASAVTAILTAWSSTAHLKGRPDWPQFEVAWELVGSSDIEHAHSHISEYINAVTKTVGERLFGGKNPLQQRVQELLSAMEHSNAVDRAEPPKAAQAMLLNLRTFKQRLVAKSLNKKVAVFADRQIGSFLFMAGLCQAGGELTEAQKQANLAAVAFQGEVALNYAGVASGQLRVVAPAPAGLAKDRERPTQSVPYFNRVHTDVSIGYARSDPVSEANLAGHFNLPWDLWKYAMYEIAGFVPEGADWHTALMYMTRQKPHKAGSAPSKPQKPKLRRVTLSCDATTSPPSAYMSWSRPYGEEVRGMISLREVSRVELDTANQIVLKSSSMPSIEGYTLTVLESDPYRKIQAHEDFKAVFWSFKTKIR